MNDLTVHGEWYDALVEDCKAIVTEAVFTSRWALVEGYWNLGHRICQDAIEVKISDLLHDLAVDVGHSERTLWYAVQVFKKYPRLDTIPEGKNITWNKLVTKYLPDGGEKKPPDAWAKLMSTLAHIASDESEKPARRRLARKWREDGLGL